MRFFTVPASSIRADSMLRADDQQPSTISIDGHPRREGGFVLAIVESSRSRPASNPRPRLSCSGSRPGFPTRHQTCSGSTRCAPRWGGGIPGADQIENHQGRQWQRWSRHIGGQCAPESTIWLRTSPTCGGAWTKQRNVPRDTGNTRRHRSDWHELITALRTVTSPRACSTRALSPTRTGSPRSAVGSTGRLTTRTSTARPTAVAALNRLGSSDALSR